MTTAEQRPSSRSPPDMVLRRRKDSMGAKDATHRSLTKRKRARSLERRTWMWPLYVVLGVLAIYAVHPFESNPVHNFLLLSYRIPESGQGQPAQYGKGLWDVAFVGFYVVLLTVTSRFCIQELLHPLARVLGIRARAKRVRFAEQMYTALYILVMGPWGLFVMRHTPVWYFDAHDMFAAYPHRTLDASLKAYYLVQAAFWLQQVVVMVLGLEQRRKDFKEFVAHHVVTVSLIALSYRFHFTHIGIAVYITHDISDFFLAVSKSLNYLQFKYQGPPFAICIAAWIYLRHYINLGILYSLRPQGEFSTVGPYELKWDAQQYKSPLSNVITFTLLAMLQSLNLFWLYCLMRSAYRLIFKGIAKDDRSEDEEPTEITLNTATEHGNGNTQGLSQPAQRKSRRP
ncbi:longevity-assurance protein 1 [Grosmannia clavigera kw1407]|uniref:Longevity-assurance protein 1 n=1 Tax=Grosmannia clavigera (strain kw1407 / UAMH 11150) TaxID=655863 RepID=F0XDS8_GROCL|nr:longevity-assurance protein 1 [Grosmannia clavigera kw1407]EFX03456.1 longevity-assurance protein 1 [Grosmannia clavigera kw1407]